MTDTLPRCTRAIGDELFPLYIDASDLPWVQELCNAITELGDCSRAHVEARLSSMAVDVPAGRRTLVMDVVRSLMRFSTRARLSPRVVRDLIFRLRAASSGSRDDIIREAAIRLSDQLDQPVSARDVDDALLADIPAQQRLSPGELDAAHVIALANQRLVRGVLARSLGIEVTVLGNARAIVRYAKLRGLIVTMTATADDQGFTMALSGPLTVCQRTTMYGKAVGDLLPQLAWCSRFALIASIVAGERTLTFRLATGAPIAPSKPPRVFDSMVERRFARDLARHTTDWTLVREAAPIQAGATLVFPDFLLRHRVHTELSCPVEIVGFWTPSYLARKLATYQDPHLAHTIVCVDQRLNCDARAFPPDVHVVPFARGRVAIEDVLATARKLHAETL